MAEEEYKLIYVEGALEDETSWYLKESEAFQLKYLDDMFMNIVNSPAEHTKVLCLIDAETRKIIHQNEASTWMNDMLEEL